MVKSTRLKKQSSPEDCQVRAEISTDNYPYKLGNPDLPFAKKRKEFAQLLDDMVEYNIPVSIMVGETGSGKTTSGPQAALETGLFDTIYVSEPRIVLTRETHKRIVEEMSDSLGYDASHLVGYGTSTESDLHPDNRIIIGTHGYISQIFIHNDRLSNALYIADEHHDREVEGDIALEVAKVRNIPSLIMSATIDTEALADFHRSYDGQRPAPIITIEGRTYPVERREMDDSSMAVAWALEQGYDTLYYLDGKHSIEKEASHIRRLTKAKFVDIPFHSELNREEQSRAFRRYDRPKLILSTNLADSGITPSVDVVVDTGLTKVIELRNGVETLTIQRASRAVSMQRAGRCGRDRPGLYIQAPYSGAPKDVMNREPTDYSVPEIQSKRLDGVVLRLAQLGLDLSTMDLSDRPKEKELERTRRRLQNIGAFSTDLVLTQIGREMARLPLNPALARMVVAARDYDDLVHTYMITAAVVAQYNGIGKKQKDKEQWRRLSTEHSSEILRDLDVYIKALNMDHNKRERHNIIDQRMEKIAKQLAMIAHREDFELVELDRLPTEIERQQLRDCIVSGIEDIYTHQGNQRYRDYVRNKKRKVGSSWSPTGSHLMAGQPWSKDIVRSGALKAEHLIRDAMVVDADTLLRVTPERCTFKNLDYEVREDGTIIVRSLIYFDEVPTRNYILRPLQESTPELREFIIDGLFQVDLANEHALPEPIRLFRREIAQMRDLAHRSIEPIGVDELLKEIKIELHNHIPAEAQTLEEILQYVDANYIRSFMLNTQRREIMTVSPNQLTVEGRSGPMRIMIEYVNRDAIITVQDYDAVRNLPAYIPELDGRKVLVKVAGSAKVESYYDVTSGKYEGNRELRRNAQLKSRVSRTDRTAGAPLKSQPIAHPRRWRSLYVR